MPEWEQRYAAEDTPWDKGAPCPGLLDFLAAHPLPGKIVVPGCGYGHDVRAIATIGNEVIGVDIARLAIERAQAFPKRASETYRTDDWFNLSPDIRGVFDWVWNTRASAPSIRHFARRMWKAHGRR